MFLHFNESAIRVFTIFAGVAIYINAMLDHTLMTNKPIFNITGAFQIMPWKIWISPYHFAAAQLAVLNHLAAFRSLFPYRSALVSEI
jgi:hypothetical protein